MKERKLFEMPDFNEADLRRVMAENFPERNADEMLASTYHKALAGPEGRAFALAVNELFVATGEHIHGASLFLAIEILTQGLKEHAIRAASSKMAEAKVDPKSQEGRTRAIALTATHFVEDAQVAAEAVDTALRMQAVSMLSKLVE